MLALLLKMLVFWVWTLVCINNYNALIPIVMHSYRYAYWTRSKLTVLNPLKNAHICLRVSISWQGWGHLVHYKNSWPYTNSLYQNLGNLFYCIMMFCFFYGQQLLTHFVSQTLCSNKLKWLHLSHCCPIGVYSMIVGVN